MARKYDKKVDYKYNVSEYFSFVKKYKFVLIALLIAVLLQETKHILDRYLFKIVVDNGTEYVTGSLLIDKFVSILIVIAFIYLIALFFNLIINWVRIHLLNRLDAGTIYDLKQKYFYHIVGLDYNFHTTHKTGSLISRLGRGAGAMERMNDTIIFDFAPLILQLSVATLALLYLDKMSALVIALTMVVFVTFSYFMQRASEKSNIIANKCEDIEKGNVSDFFTNIDSIRHFGKEKMIKERFSKLSTKTKLAFLKNWDYWRFTSSIQGLILGIGTFFLIYFPIKQFLAGQITLGTLTFIYSTYTGLVGPMFSFVHGIRNLSRAMADFQDLFEYGKVSSEIKDKHNAKKLEIKNGEIEFNNVAFRYGKRNIFDGLNLKVPANKKYALVGHSGSGKTTLIKLLYRLYDINYGSILIDRESIGNFTQESLRSEMSIVPQECVLFDDTIYNNILFSNPKATRKQVFEAIKFAQLDKIIQNFPKKELTIVGERGVKLSGGEKQRVSIARAILANKKVLVLDEATSSLDSQTEFEIQKDLEKLMENRTSIIIAHRLSTIMKADKIIVLDKGKIVQQGTHSQLIKQEGQYKKLWNLQKGGYIK